jgi:glycerol-3-phosphate dehydrogenase
VKIEFSSKKITKQDQNSTIKVNADDLLYAVTHTPKEVKKYYAKYNIDREDVLKTIRNELKKSNIKVNPNTILAEVERTIDDEFFENTFMKSLKRRVSDIAVAIASRND